MYGCAATFAGVWIIAWVPAPEEPSAGPNDLGGASDEETDLFASDGLPAGGGVGPKPGNVPILEPRRSTVSLVGISPAQVQSSVFCSFKNQHIALFSQRLILVHTPPRPEVPLGQELGVAWEAEHSSGGRRRGVLDGSIGVGRRRVITLVADGSPTARLGSRISDRGSVERRWTTTDGPQNVQRTGE
jgi:hypothetical protein